MNYLIRIQRAFESVIGTTGALTVTADADMESVHGWDSESFIPLIIALEDEFLIDIPTLDAAALYSVKAISEFVTNKLNEDC